MSGEIFCAAGGECAAHAAFTGVVGGEREGPTAEFAVENFQVARGGAGESFGIGALSIREERCEGPWLFSGVGHELKQAFGTRAGLRAEGLRELSASASHASSRRHAFGGEGGAQARHEFGVGGGGAGAHAGEPEVVVREGGARLSMGEFRIFRRRFHTGAGRFRERRWGSGARACSRLGFRRGAVQAIGVVLVAGRDEGGRGGRRGLRVRSWRAREGSSPSRARWRRAAKASHCSFEGNSNCAFIRVGRVGRRADTELVEFVGCGVGGGRRGARGGLRGQGRATKRASGGRGVSP